MGRGKVCDTSRKWSRWIARYLGFKMSKLLIKCLPGQNALAVDNVLVVFNFGLGELAESDLA
jgi:hypothetical protein